MKIKMMADGEVLQGSPIEIVEAMQYKAFGQQDKSLPEYMRWAASMAGTVSGQELEVKGQTPEAMADSFLQGMLAAGLAQEV